VRLVDAGTSRMKLIAEMALPLLPVEQPGRPSARRRRSRTARSLGAVYYAGELAGARAGTDRQHPAVAYILMHWEHQELLCTIGSP